MSEVNCHIANFNCTFNVNGDTKPLLEYFDSVFFKALIQSGLTREAKKNSMKVADYFFIDVKLVEISEGELAVVGKHVKRAYLRINQDITPEGIVTPIGEVKNSAPTSTFILLLRNHKLIYFKNDLLGSPDIRSFNTTVREVVKKYIRKNRINLINELKKTNFIFEEIKFNNIKSFTEQVLNKKYPYSEINVVPIQSKELLEEKFTQIHKIKRLKLSIYNLNSENHFEDYFTNVSHFASRIGTQRVEQTANNVENIAQVHKVIESSSQGKIDYIIDGYTDNNEKIKLTPDKVSEVVNVEIDDTSSEIDNCKTIYNFIKERREIKNNSEENIKNYIEKKDDLLRLKTI